MKTTLLLAAASVSAFGLAGCGQTSGPKATLDCPPTQGKLNRTGVAADGKSCTYVSEEGAQVTLSYLPVTTGADAALDALEARLLPANAPADPADAGAARKDAPEAKGAATDSKASDGRTVVIQLGKTRQGAVTEDGETTTIDLPGVHIQADANDRARVQLGPMTVDASGEMATIRIRRDVRLKGQAFARERRGVRASLVTHSGNAADGRRTVGYAAGGPKTGPLVVGVMRATIELSPDGHTLKDVTRLVRRNAGV